MTPHMITQGSVAWRAPSNLAIVKYWGKYGVQLPRNASLSFTLSAAYTDMLIKYESSSSPRIVESFLFEGAPNNLFAEKIERYCIGVTDELPWLTEVALHIESSNSFPHSSGIASSASSMAALALCLTDIHVALGHSYDSDEERLQHASHLARLASGSASRSVYGPMSAWGSHSAVHASSNLHAIKYDDIDPVFSTYHDDICIVSAGEKSVSSTAGHQLMNGNVYAAARYQQANDRMQALVDILRAGDVVAFGQLAEDEAMSLHGMMMCSDPSYMLMESGTIEMIRRIRAFRSETGVPLYFSLDAGPNIHLLYPHDVREIVSGFVQEDLRPLCVDGRVISDQVGQGPCRL